MSGLEALVVGIDAGCLPVFERLIEDDRIPTIESICTDGVAGALESQMPPWTPSAWPSIFTGLNPGKHGVFGFVAYDGYDWRVVNGNDVEGHRLWTLLDKHGKTSVVVNVPVTHPPDEIDGAIIPGFMAPENPTCHPEGILDDVREAIGDYRVYPAYARGDEDVPDEEKIAEYERLVRMRGEAFRYLADRFDPEFGFVQFQKPDTVFHEFGGDWEKVQAVYEATDREIRETLDAHDPDRVFIVSDHGIGKYHKSEFRVNEFLHDRGYVKATRGGKGMPSWNPIRHKLRDGRNDGSWEPGIAGRLAAGVAKLGFTTDRVGSGLQRIGLHDIAKRYAPSEVVRTGTEQVDFAESVAYMRARTELGVRINLKGREPDGVVPPAEYPATRAELMEQLRSVSAPDGEPVFEEVVPREKYFSGPHVEDAVDIVTVPNDFQHFLSAQLGRERFGPPTEPWNHKLHGVFAAAGERIDPTASVAGAHIYDVAPTVLASLGVEPDEQMDGEVLPPVEDATPRDYAAYDGVAEGERAEVEDRLADLGYLE